MAIFADNFTGADGTLLDAHTPDTGTSWTRLWGTTGTNAEINTNRCRSDGDLNSGVMYTADTTYPSADYDITCTMVTLATQNDRPIFLLVRIQDQENMYGVRIETTASESSLYKKVSGTWTAVGSLFTKPADGSVIKLEIIGTALKFYDDGVVIASARVSDISAAGKAGIAFGGGTELVAVGDDGSTTNVIDTLTVNNLATNPTLTASAGAFTLTGVAATLTRNITLTAAAASFTLTGVAAGLKRNVPLTASAGSFTLTGVSANLLQGYKLTAAAGAFTLTGTATGLKRSITIAAGTGAFTLTGIDTALAYSGSTYTLTASAAAFTLTGNAANLLHGYKITAAAGAFTLTGVSAGLYHGYKLTASAGSFTLSGVSAGLYHGYYIGAVVGAFTLTGVPATLTYTPAGGSTYTLTASTGAFTLTGLDAILTHIPFNPADPAYRLLKPTGLFSKWDEQGRLTTRSNVPIDAEYYQTKPGKR